MEGQTDFSGRSIERKQTLPIDLYETWPAQNTQKHDMAQKTARVLHAPTPEYASCSLARTRAESHTRDALAPPDNRKPRHTACMCAFLYVCAQTDQTTVA
jgi:hypothetical protein